MALEALIKDLRAEGHRITKVRRAVLSQIISASGPLSALQLLAALKQGELIVNKTTVYREIDFLKEAKLVREVDLLDGTKRYELLEEGSHHHHLVCTNCRKVQCVEMQNDLDALERRVGRKYRFQIQSHVLEFFGRCSDCKI